VSVNTPPPSPMNAATLIAISAVVTVTFGCVTERIVRTGVVCRAQSGQRMPTGEVVMQSGQIGRPQFEHDTAVSRLGWR